MASPSSCRNPGLERPPRAGGPARRGLAGGPPRLDPRRGRAQRRGQEHAAGGDPRADLFYRLDRGQLARRGAHRLPAAVLRRRPHAAGDGGRLPGPRPPAAAGLLRRRARHAPADRRAPRPRRPRGLARAPALGPLGRRAAARAARQRHRSRSPSCSSWTSPRAASTRWRSPGWRRSSSLSRGGGADGAHGLPRPRPGAPPRRPGHACSTGRCSGTARRARS